MRSPESKIFFWLHFVLFSILYFLFCSVTHAASPVLYFSSTTESVHVGDSFEVKVLIDSDQPLNAYAVTLTYSSDVLELFGIDNGRSIMDVWQKQPVISGGTVTFNGGSIKPFSGTGGELLALQLRAIKEGTARLSVNDAAVYLANGKGTKAIPSRKEDSFAIAAQTSTTTGEQTPQPGEIDDMPPSIPFLSLIDNPFNKGQKLLAFMVSDAGSGIRATSVRFFTFLSWGEWLPARNPTAIPESAWIIKFRVVDNGGNIIERDVYDWQGLRSPPFLALGAILVGLVSILYMALSRKLKHSA